MTMKIRIEGDPILRKKARPISKINRRIQALAEDMFETMYAANGAGLAAPQIGKDIRLVVIDAGDGAMALINPVIIKSSGSESAFEGCLSIPGVSGKVDRAQKVAVEATDIYGKPLLFEAVDMTARAIQHEIDHLDGILFTDKAKEIRKE